MYCACVDSVEYTRNRKNVHFNVQYMIYNIQCILYIEHIVLYTYTAHCESQPSGIYTLSNLPRTRYSCPGAQSSTWIRECSFRFALLHIYQHNCVLAHLRNCAIAFFAQLFTYLLFCTGERLQICTIGYLPSTFQNNCIFLDAGQVFEAIAKNLTHSSFGIVQNISISFSPILNVCMCV